MEIEWGKIVWLEGRIGRGGFWKLAWIPLLLVIIPTWWAMETAPNGGEAYDSLFFGGFAFSVVLAWASVRRLHDLGRPGWWSLVLILPFALAYLPIVSLAILLWPLIVLVWLLLIGSTEGDHGPNRYGWPGGGSPFSEERRAGQPQTPMPRQDRVES